MHTARLTKKITSLEKILTEMLSLSKSQLKSETDYWIEDLRKTGERIRSLKRQQ